MSPDLVDTLLLAAGIAWVCLVVLAMHRELTSPSCFDDIEG